MLENYTVPLKKMRKAVEDFADNLFQWNSPKVSDKKKLVNSAEAEEGVQGKKSPLMSDSGFSTPLRRKNVLAYDHHDDVTEEGATPKRRKTASRINTSAVPHAISSSALDVTSEATSGDGLKTPKNEVHIEGPTTPKVRRGRRSIFLDQEKESTENTPSPWESPKHVHERRSIECNQKAIGSTTPIRCGIECYKERMERQAAADQ